VLEDGERILVKNQTLASENGIYEAHSGAWNRAPDADSWDELVAAFVFVEMGNLYADTGWICTVDSEGYLGDPVNWTQFSAAGLILAGNGLVKSGNYLHFATAGGYTVNQIPITTGATTIGFIANGSANQMLRVPSGGGTPEKKTTASPEKRREKNLKVFLARGNQTGYSYCVVGWSASGSRLVKHPTGGPDWSASRCPQGQFCTRTP
jgi:hypothetical protein